MEWDKNLFFYDADKYNIIVSREATLSAENSGKPLGCRGSTRTPLGELTALTQTP